jgi:hypothetical protein
VVLALGLAYGAVNTIYPGPALAYSISLVLAASALAAARQVTGTFGALGLRLRPPHRTTIIALASSALLSIPVTAVVGRAEAAGWGVVAAAAASAIAQESYFRGALLATLRARLPSPRSATLLQAGLFSAWHVRAFLAVSPPAALAVLAVAFLASCLWGWLALKDGTIAWVTTHHALLLAIQ